jgi:methionyl-tRNA synthetase
MSKSLGTAIDPIVAADRFGADPLRLFLIKEIAFGGDGDFTWERYDERYNTDLANNLGNLVSRVVTMAHRYRGGRLTPAAGPSDQLVRLAEQVVADYKRAMETFAIHEAAAAAYRLIDATNEFIAATSPWALESVCGRSFVAGAVRFGGSHPPRPCCCRRYRARRRDFARVGASPTP